MADDEPKWVLHEFDNEAKWILQEFGYLHEQFNLVHGQIQLLMNQQRKPPSRETMKIHLLLLERYSGLCPCGHCQGEQILLPGEPVSQMFTKKRGRPGGLASRWRGVWDHWYHRGRREIPDVWPISLACNRWAEQGTNRDTIHPSFIRWQSLIRLLGNELQGLKELEMTDALKQNDQLPLWESLKGIKRG